MTANADEIVVGANGKVYVAETSATMPTGVSGTMPTGWTDLGFVTEDGVTFTDSKETETIGAWQSFYPVRRIVTSKDASVSFALRQWNKDTVALAFGGGTVTEPTANVFKYTPPDPEDIDERALCLEFTDGSKVYRLVMEKGMVSDAVETQLVRTGAADLPITFSATPDSGDDAYYLLTNDSALDPS